MHIALFTIFNSDMKSTQTLYHIPEIKLEDHLTAELKTKKLVVLRSKEDESTAIDEMFHKMMAAIHIDIDKDVAIIRLEDSAEVLESVNWISKSMNQHVLVFGLSPAQIGLNINHLPYRPMRLYNSSILFCHTLEAIHFDVNLKKRLWKALKEQFN